MNLARRRYRADNYLYLITQGEDAALVDPGDPAVALTLAREAGARPRFILHTHGHADHTAGSVALARELGARVYGSARDAWGGTTDVALVGGEELALGALRVAVHAAPGHTAGSLLFESGGHLLTGDTLFWGGAGNCKSGDPRVLAETFLGVLSRLGGRLRVEPGHDYAEQNLRFARELDPGCSAAAARLAEVRAARAGGEEPTAYTLEEERAVNPFLRVAELTPALRARTGLPLPDARDAFVALRAAKDAWRG